MQPQLSTLVPFVLLSTLVSAPAAAQRSGALPAPGADVKYPPLPAPEATATPTRPAVAPASDADSAAKTAAPSAQTPRIEPKQVEYALDPAGATWARGANYKMRFDAQGADFVPFFGSSAPRNFDLQFALVEASVAGADLALDAGAKPNRVGDVVTFQRGSVDEVFELALDGVEHKFVVPALPTTGEMRVRIAFESELAASADSDGWLFANDFGHVRYGHATAIDADGTELALEGQLVGQSLEFVVPAEFVDAASFPLVIDPVIATYAVEGGSAQSLSPDVVYDWSGGYAMHCWEQVYSQSDHDVYSVICDVYGNPIGSTGGYIDVSSANWARPRCAYLPGQDRYGFVAEVGAPGFRQTWGLVRAPYWSFSSGQFRITDPGLFNETLNADIGADPYTGGPAFFCVVYERATPWDHDIHGQLISFGGVPSGGTIYIDNSLFTFDSVPSISKTNDARDWNVVWQRETGIGSLDICAARVHWQGSITTPTFYVANSAGRETNPSVSGPIAGTNRFAVAYEYDYTTDHDILVTLVDDSTLLTSRNLSVSEGGAFLQDQRFPTIECDGAHFACTYSELYGSSTTDYDPYIAEFGYAGSDFVLAEAHRYLAYTYAVEVQTAIASRRSSNSSGAVGQYVTAWSSRGSASGGPDNIQAATFNGTVGGPITAFCGGSASTCPCANGVGNGAGCTNSIGGSGRLFASGNAATTADTLTLQYDGMPAGVSALLFQGWTLVNGGVGAPFGDGLRCVSAPVFRFPMRQADGNGLARFGWALGDTPVSLLGYVPASGGVAYYQVWYRDSADYCSSQTTNFTNALAVTWTP